MPDVREQFPEIEKMEVGALHERRTEILASAKGSYDTLDDDSLAQLLQISRTLRRKAAAPGGPGKPKKSKEPASLDELA